MSLIPTPPPLKQALAHALAAERQAKEIDTSQAWQSCADAWRNVARLNREITDARP